MDPCHSRFVVLSFKLMDLHYWVEPNGFDHVNWECMFWDKTHAILSCDLLALLFLDLSYMLWLVIIAWYMLYGSHVLLWCYFLLSRGLLTPLFNILDLAGPEALWEEAWDGFAFETFFSLGGVLTPMSFIFRCILWHCYLFIHLV